MIIYCPSSMSSLLKNFDTMYDLSKEVKFSFPFWSTFILSWHYADDEYFAPAIYISRLIRSYYTDVDTEDNHTLQLGLYDPQPAIYF